MIRHIVLLRAGSDTDAGELAAVLAGLAALRGRLPGMLDFHAGPDVSPEGLQRGYTHAFTIDFADVPARDAYLVDPNHKALGGRLAATVGGRESILVLDFAL
ncbi:MAG: Dabb family protein [Rhodospirillales bacterium]|nr:Dabb family protein [Rhodospirillales bacterium]